LQKKDEKEEKKLVKDASIFKTSYTKDELASLADKIDKQISNILALKKIDEKQEVTSLHKIALILKSIPLQDLVCSEIQEKYYSGSLPKISGYAGGIKFEKATFTDCAETAVRNLCNIAQYDQQTNTFKFDKFPVKFELKKFYEANPDPVLVEAHSTHQDWVWGGDNAISLVENRPFIAYNRIITVGGQEKAIAPEDTQGFIYGPSEFDKKEIKEEKSVKRTIQVGGKAVDFDQIIIHGRTYLIYDPKKYHGYEVQPSLRNVIILMNDLLSLGLFKDEKGEEKAFAQEFAKNDFNAIYFETLCKKLDWEPSSEITKALDEQDYAAGISLEIRVGKAGFNLRLSTGHGEVNPSQAASRIPAFKKSFFLLLLENITEKAFRQQIANLGALYEQTSFIEEKQDNVFFNNPHAQNLVYGLDMDDINERVNVIEKILNSNADAFYRLAAELIKSLPFIDDLVYQIHVLRYMLPTHLENKRLKQAVEDMAGLAKKSNDDSAKSTLCIRLIVLGLAYEQGTAIAVKLAKTNTKSNIHRAVLLFMVLVDKGQAYHEATTFAVEFAKTNTDKDSINLFETLLREGQAYKEASECVSKFEDPESKKKMENLLKKYAPPTNTKD